MSNILQATYYDVNTPIVYYLLLLKPGALAQVETKVVCTLLSQPHKHLRHEQLNKTQLREATN